jgi:hypothetical protein
VAAVKATHNPPTDAPVTPAVVLRCAATYLDAHGWARGAFFEPDSDAPFPAACAVGAIRLAVYGSLDAAFPDGVLSNSADFQLTTRTQRVFAAHLNPCFDPEQISAIDVIGDWNDADGRTLAEVIANLIEAADTWENTHTTPVGGRP